MTIRIVSSARAARLLLLALFVAGLSAAAGAARADFRLCNKTNSRIGVSIGYKEKDTWSTEGWWNVSANSCETILRGALSSRFYYVYAIDYDRGGEWNGKAYMCTRDKEFTIRGIEDCLARGYDRSGFFEIDTGEQGSWTVQLTEPTAKAAQPASPQPTPAPRAAAPAAGASAGIEPGAAVQ
ncbi:hypothetical protein GCM10008171_23140 [Methylopila jiangsuensis]|uniref:DUF1036 domain-containing protein n=1 Tax=Methylopila jiangsuensis TaxID=586230 RepID=A0A9W6JJL5_9HYPH|nr:DUF1036 domain-containing protein [Methylopila jiangsuensis]MDR6286600.1 putative membrane protein [Methylopila jiangsuensis]GLK77060.1 hypothetical protein GCM10008171_23140 [Methylopila jiangsuensis]